MFGVALRIRLKKFHQNLVGNCSKSTKLAIAACKFKKFFRGSMPPDPLEPFLFLNQLQISSTEKNTLEKNVKIMPPLLKFLTTPLSAVHQHFSYEGSKFRSKVVVKDSQDCDSIIPLHFCLLFANYL